MRHSDTPVYARPMRTGFKLLTALALACLSLTCLAQTTTISINSAGDAGKAPAASSGQCWTGQVIGGQQECTLRAAIQAANERSGQINIVFSDIPVGSNQFSTILIGSALPTISRRVEIRGQTHPNWSTGRTNVVIRGSSSGAIRDYNGLTFGAGSDNSRVENIGISAVNDAITIDSASNLTITNCYLAGGLANAVDIIGNGRDGLRLISSNGNLITNNFFRANNRYGIYIASGSNTNVISNNRFGVRPSGSTFGPFEDSANGSAGIFVAGTAGEDNQLGSFGGNYFANNGNSAIRIFGGGQLITNNRIGLPPVQGLANNFTAEDYANGGDAAIFLASGGNQVGTGTTTGNVIGNADQIGILVGRLTPTAISANNNLIAGNRIGVDSDDTPYGMSDGVQLLNGSGTVVRNNIIANNLIGIRTQVNTITSSIRSNQILNNSTDGIRMTGGGVIGGGSSTMGNVIGGGGRGILVFNTTAPVGIGNNFIGTNADAESLPNTTGIQIQGNTEFVDVGGQGAGNVIGNSTATGLFLGSGANDVWAKSNYIGIHPNGTPMGNQTGILISGNAAAFENIIGYGVFDVWEPLSWLNDIGRGNVIAHNAGRGVWVTGDDEAILNSIRGNRFFANGGRDIDLGMSGIDGGGGNTGPNTQLNWPEISPLTNFDPASWLATVELGVNTFEFNADYPLLIDLYLVNENNPTRPAFIRTIEYPESSALNFLTVTFQWPGGIPFDGSLVATASDQPSEAFANTSQFSPPYSLELGPGALATATANNGSGSVYLDLEAADQVLNVTGFDLSIAGQAGTSVDVEVYVLDGSYVGQQGNPGAWTLHETVTYERAGSNAFATAALSAAIQLLPGEIRAVYLQAVSGEGGIRYTGTLNAPPQTEWSNADLSLFSHSARNGSSAFGGTLFSPRAFSGIVRYEVMMADELFRDRFEQ